MNQAAIGVFIAECRKAKGLTQNQLAEKLGITDKAVSKWETGKSMPDISLFMPLCSLLGITLNELMLGEYISEEHWKEKSNQVLFDVLASWLGRGQPDLRPSAEKPEYILQLRDVCKTYSTDAPLAVNNVSFAVEKGSFVGIMGASGSGKSTLLNMIATIDKATSGTIEISGQNVADVSEEDLAAFRRAHLGFVFQEYNLLDTLTIYENIALALTIRHTPAKNINTILTGLAKNLAILDILHKFPTKYRAGSASAVPAQEPLQLTPALF